MKICGKFERTYLFSFPYILLVFVILPILGHASADSEIEELEPRKPLVVTDIAPPSWRADAEPEEPPAGEEPQYRLTMKFRDDLKVRAGGNGSVTSTIGKEMLQIASLRSRFKVQFKPLIPAWRLHEERSVAWPQSAFIFLLLPLFYIHVAWVRLKQPMQKGDDSKD